MSKLEKFMIIVKLFLCVVILTIMIIEIVKGEHLEAILSGVSFLIVRGTIT